MKKLIPETRLTLYKTHHDCQHFGEALLRAANEGRLGLNHINGNPTQEVLWQLGIALTMTRDQITICLSRLMDEYTPLLAYLTDGHHLSSTRIQLRRVIDLAICYTEQDAPKGNSMDVAEVFA